MIAPNEIRNDGQRRLVEVCNANGWTAEMLGRALGVSRQSTSAWLSGAKLPDGANRSTLAEIGVPPTSWDLGVGAPPRTYDLPPAPAATPPAPTQAWAPMSTAPNFAGDDVVKRELAHQCSRLHADLARARHPDPSDAFAVPATADVIVKLEREYTKALERLGKVNRELTPAEESKLAKSVTFKRFVATVLRALEPYDDALAAAVAAIEAAGGNASQG